MNTIPTTILDNFFDNPDAVRNWALSLEYNPDSLGKWPGKRSKDLRTIHPVFSEMVCRKVLSLFFENITNLQFNINLAFQLIENYQGEGWIHQDPDIFTFIIYLHYPNPKINCGTSLWSLNSNLVSPINNVAEAENLAEKNYLHHKNKKSNKEYHNSFTNNFTNEISIPDKYNRFIAFSSELFHSANNLSPISSPRLTLIGFVSNLNTSNLPITRFKQTPIM